MSEKLDREPTARDTIELDQANAVKEILDRVILVKAQMETWQRAAKSRD